MKRTKHVFHTSEIPHLWVYQKQDNARNPQNNFFFEDKSIYSYGHHFEIARIVKPGVILFTSRNYSNTTSSHKSCVYHAIPYNKFKVFTFDFRNGVKSGINEYETDLRNIQTTMTRAKLITSITWSYSNYVTKYKEFLRYIAVFKLKGKAKKQLKTLLNINQITDLQTNLILKREESIAKNNLIPEEIREAKRAKAREQREALKLKKVLEIVEKWRKFEQYYLPFGYSGIDYLRYNATDKTIETSRGIAVNIDLCHKLYNKIKTKQDIKGYKLADFTVIGLNGTLKIGCHNIPLSEIEYIANLLKW